MILNSKSICVRLSISLLLILSTSSCVTENSTSIYSSTSNADLVLRDLELIEYQGTTELWEFKAQATKINYAENQMIAQVIKVKFFDTTAIEPSFSSLNAGRAQVDTTSNNITFYDNVTLLSPDGRTLHTDTLTWNNKEQLLKSDSVVRLEKDNATISGRGLITKPDLSNIKILNDVKITNKNRKEAF